MTESTPRTMEDKGERVFGVLHAVGGADGGVEGGMGGAEAVGAGGFEGAIEVAQGPAVGGHDLAAKRAQGTGGFGDRFDLGAPALDRSLAMIWT